MSNFINATLLMLCAFSSLLRVQAIDLSKLEDVNIPLFDTESGMRWGQLYFKGIEVESSIAGPFEVDALKSARLSHLTLRFTHWPANTGLSVCLQPLAAWAGGSLPETLPSFRIECEGQWALMLEDLSILPVPSVVAGTDEEVAFRIRAGKAIYIQPGKAREFSDAQIKYNKESHSVILATSSHESFHIQLFAQSI